MCRARLRSEAKIFPLSGSSERSFTAYFCSIAIDNSSMSSESRPSPAPKSGASGSMSSGATPSRCSDSTIRRASSGSPSCATIMDPVGEVPALQARELGADPALEVLHPAVVVLVDAAVGRPQVLAALELDAVLGGAVGDVHDRRVRAKVEGALQAAGTDVNHAPAQSAARGDDGLPDLARLQSLSRGRGRGGVGHVIDGHGGTGSEAQRNHGTNDYGLDLVPMHFLVLPWRRLQQWTA